MTITLRSDPRIHEDEYQIDAKRENAILTAGGISGIFAAMGDYLRHCSFDGQGNCLPFEGHFSQKPSNPIHGIYFASHFRNFYEMAPIEQIYELIEDLALRGCNALMLWYDMHQFDEINTPDSLRLIARMKQCMNHATLVGMKTVFETLANEAFRTSPMNLRAEWSIQNGYTQRPTGHYHVELCPNKDGGLDEILRQRRTVMNAFSDTKIDYISIWPYDQGGCTCDKCAPWGTRGFLKAVHALVSLYKDIRPDACCLCATWYFDRFTEGEWDGFAEALHIAGVDEKIAYFFGYFSNREKVPNFVREGRMPGNRGMLAFPEISMWGAEPWGGYGANPLPMRLEQNFRKNGSLYCGAIPYSEGIFEDINKSLTLAFYSGKTDSAEEVIREYGRYEFCLDEELVNDFWEMISAMEETLPRTITDKNGTPIDLKDTKKYAYEDLRCIIQNTERIEEIEHLAEKIHSSLPRAIQSGWRWQVLYLRAKMDAELLTHRMHFSENLETYAEALKKLYFADHAYYVVTPLTRKALRDVLGGTIL